MKYLLLLVVLGVALWMFNARRRVRPPKTPPNASPDAPPDPSSARNPQKPAAAVSEMQACAHCGLHVPQAEALVDASSRAYCSESHRQAGPR